MGQLDQLRDIHLPDPITWWYPNAAGWYIVFIILILAITYLVWHYLKYRHINKQVQALMDIPKLERPLQIMMTIKAAAVTHSPLVANRLQGTQWTKWLQEQNIILNEQWQYWLEKGYLDNQQPPKDWHKKLPSWLKKLS